MRSTFCASKLRLTTCISALTQYDIRAFSVPLFDLGSACCGNSNPVSLKAFLLLTRVTVYRNIFRYGKSYTVNMDSLAPRKEH